MTKCNANLHLHDSIRFWALKYDVQWISNLVNIFSKPLQVHIHCSHCQEAQNSSNIYYTTSDARASLLTHCTTCFGWWSKRKFPNRLNKMVVDQIFGSTICAGWQKPQQTLIPDLDWSDVLIGSGGLLLVGSDLLLSQVHVHGWSLASINN